jgi:hypothetical protein
MTNSLIFIESFSMRYHQPTVINIFHHVTYAFFPVNDFVSPVTLLLQHAIGYHEATHVITDRSC